MEFATIAAVVGFTVSAISALISFLWTKRRIKVNEEIKRTLYKELPKYEELLDSLEKAKNRGSIESEVKVHIAEYDRIIRSLANQLPSDDRRPILEALSQQSKRGRISYITKLLSRAMSSA